MAKEYHVRAATTSREIMISRRNRTRSAPQLILCYQSKKKKKKKKRESAWDCEDVVLIQRS